MLVPFSVSHSQTEQMKLTAEQQTLFSVRQNSNPYDRSSVTALWRGRDFTYQA